MFVEQEILREKGGVMNGQLHLGNMTFDLGDSVNSKTTLPKGTVRKWAALYPLQLNFSSILNGTHGNDLEQYQTAILMVQVNMSSTDIDALITKEIKQLSGFWTLSIEMHVNLMTSVDLGMKLECIGPRTVSAGHKFTIKIDYDHAIYHSGMRSFCNSCMQIVFAHVWHEV